MTQETRNFLAYDYTELKDLAKAFLTLISAILVFSITFSDKVVDFPRSGIAVRVCLIAGWSFFSVAIVSCGVAICLNYCAEIAAVHSGEGLAVFRVPFFGFESIISTGPVDYDWLAGTAGAFMFFAGSFFVLGLWLLVASAIISVVVRKPPSDFS